MTGPTAGHHAGTTGPAGHRERYWVDNPRQHHGGGTGAVFEATLNEETPQAPAGTHVGLKMLLTVDRQRYAKLAERSALLPRHPNLATHLECFEGPSLLTEEDEEEDYYFYSAHVWIPGTTLADEITEASVADLFRWATDVASAIDALHAVPGGGLAYRDLHLRNVVVGPDSRAVLIDFDALLWGDHADTTLTSLHSARRLVGSSGIEGSKAIDRSTFALLLLRCLARDRRAEYPYDDLRERAQATLSSLPNAAGAVLYVMACLESPPETAIEIINNTRAYAATKACHRPSARTIGATIVIASTTAAVLAGGVIAAAHYSTKPRTGSLAGGVPTQLISPAVSTTVTLGYSKPSDPTAHRSRTKTPTAAPNSTSSAPSHTFLVGPAKNGSSASPTGHHSPKDPAPSLKPSPPIHSTAAVTTYTAETSGSVVHTWADPSCGCGAAGPTLALNETVAVTCRLQGLTVSDGNTWWYRINSSPWSDDYYGSADAFYNNGATSGPLAGTPWLDAGVPLC